MGKHPAPVPQGPPILGARCSLGPRTLFHSRPAQRRNPGSHMRWRRPAGTWRIITEQEALELHFLAPGPQAEPIRSHGNGQTAAGGRGACAGALAAGGRRPGCRLQSLVLLGLQVTQGRRGVRPSGARAGGARPAPAVASYAFGFPGAAGGSRARHGDSTPALVFAS